MNIAVVVLAGGASDRMGTPKQLLRAGSETLLRRSVNAGLGSSATRRIVVTGANAAEVSRELSGLPVEIIHNPNWQQGIGSSIHTGIEWLMAHGERCDAVVLTVCDQPHVTPETLNRLIEEFHAGQKGIIASGYAGTVGVPALFASEYFAALRDLQGRTGAKSLMTSHPDDIATIPFEAGEIDLDTPDQFEAYKRCTGIL